MLIELEELEAQKIAARLNERHLGETIVERKSNLELANKIVEQLCEFRNTHQAAAGREERDI